MNKNTQISIHTFMFSLAGGCFLLGILSFIGYAFHRAVFVNGDFILGPFVLGGISAFVASIITLIFVITTRCEIKGFDETLKFLTRLMGWLCFCFASFGLVAFSIDIVVSAFIKDHTIITLLFCFGISISILTLYSYFVGKVINFLLRLDDFLEECAVEPIDCR